MKISISPMLWAASSMWPGGCINVQNTIGVDIRSENIISNNLGFITIRIRYRSGVTDSAFYTKQYGRTNMAYFQEHVYNAGNFRISGGIMINWNSAYPDKPSLFPGLDRELPAAARHQCLLQFQQGIASAYIYRFVLY